jgi:catechol 2,3-dioxygenase-like lactoylglutathione lyase family enzyme
MVKPSKDSVDVGLLVCDISAPLHFYKDLLGLALVETVPVRLGTMYRLRFGTSDFKLIEPKPAPPKGPAGLETQLGFRYITFPIQNLAEISARLKENKVEFISERELRPGVRIALVKDPEGNVIELLERKG